MTEAVAQFLSDLRNADKALFVENFTGRSFIFEHGLIVIEWEWPALSKPCRTILDDEADIMEVQNFTGFAEARALQLFHDNVKPKSKPDFLAARGILAELED